MTRRWCVSSIEMTAKLENAGRLVVLVLPDAGHDAHVPSSGDGTSFEIQLVQSRRADQVALQGEADSFVWELPFMGKAEGGR